MKSYAIADNISLENVVIYFQESYKYIDKNNQHSVARL